MTPFFLTLGLLFFAWIVHVVWWRISLPRRQTRALLIVFGAVPAVAAAYYWWKSGVAGVSAFDLPGMALFYAAATGCYLLTYAGVEESSPSLTIFRALERAGTNGLGETELAGLITDDRFVRPRLEALRRDGLVEATAAGNRLTRRGRRLALLAQKLGALFNIDRSA